ncbi:MAG: hypothetical protein M1308_24085 [Actinobacteria bacterium]|nr:hypothetical protein [Actinomycetota bacterium]
MLLKTDYNGRIIGTEFKIRSDFALLGKSLGAEGVTVKEVKDLKDAIDYAINLKKPIVLDFIIDINSVSPPTAGFWASPFRSLQEPILRRK